MPTRVFPIRASEAERAVWQAAAERAGSSFNAWARRALNAGAEMDAALSRQAAEERVSPAARIAALVPGVELASKFKGPDPRRKP